MDWQSVNFDWNHARAFLVTAEEGSLSAAARSLGMTQPTLGRQVSALETELGVTLFERVGRGLVLTNSGIELLEHVRHMGNAANHVSLAASGQSQTLEGNICISASEVSAAFILPAIIKQLRKAHPGIQVKVLATNEVSDLIRREADIAIRNFRPTQAELIAKKIRQSSARLYAAKQYLAELREQHGLAENEILSKSILNTADYIAFDNSKTYFDALLALGLDLKQSNFPIAAASHLVQWQMVKQGLGIGVMTDDIAKAEPLVEIVLPRLPAFDFPIWLTTHRELRTSRRVRVVFDFLAEGLLTTPQADR